MPEVLSIEWCSDRLRGVVAQVDGDRARVRKVFEALWPDAAPPTVPGATATADWLRGQLAEANCTGRDVHVHVPRSSTVVRRLELPPVPDDELPDMVAMQAATRASSGMDELALDFVPLPSGPDAKTRRVLAATIARRLLDTIAKVCEEAGLRLRSVGLGSFATAELVARATADEAHPSALVVGVHDGTLETILLRDRDVLLAQSTELHADDPALVGKAVAADVRRTLMAQGDGLSANALDHVWFLGEPSETAAARAVVGSTLDVAVEAFDPFDNSVVSGQHGKIDAAVFAAAVGGVFTAGDARVAAFDFRSPRKPPKRIDHAKRRRIAIAAAVAATLLLALGWWGAMIWRLDGEIADLRKRERELQKIVRDGAPVRQKAARIRDWESLRRDWADELVTFADQLPPSDRLLLDEFEASIGARDPVGTVKGVGRARSRDDLERTQSRLDEIGYDVPAFDVSRRSTGDGYDQRFVFDVSLPIPGDDETEEQP